MLPRLITSRATAEASSTNAALFNNGTNSSYSNLGDIIGQPVPSAITRIWFSISALTSESFEHSRKFAQARQRVSSTVSDKLGQRNDADVSRTEAIDWRR